MLTSILYLYPGKHISNSGVQNRKEKLGEWGLVLLYGMV